MSGELLFWLSDTAREAVAPQLPHGRPGKPRVDDHRAISGLLQVLKTGWRRRDVSGGYGPSTPICNGHHRWSQRRIRQGIFGRMAAAGPVPEDRRNCRRTALTPRRTAPPRAQAIGTWRGGRTSKIHALTDDPGRAVAFALTRGRSPTSPWPPRSRTGLPHPGRLPADKAQDGERSRSWLKKRRIKAG